MSNREGRINLWTVAADGGTPERLTKGPTVDYQPAWSPDGKWIAYGSGDRSRSQGGDFNLSVIPAGGGPSIPLTEGFTFVTKPSWAPDGSILFSGEKSGILNVWRVSLREGRRAGPPTRVTLGQGQDTDTAVSRDGRILAFSATGNEPNIWEIPLDGGSAREVTRGGSPDYPQLSPDGKTLLIQSSQTGKARRLDGGPRTDTTSRGSLLRRTSSRRRAGRPTESGSGTSAKASCSSSPSEA